MQQHYPLSIYILLCLKSRYDPLTETRFIFLLVYNKHESHFSLLFWYLNEAHYRE